MPQLLATRIEKTTGVVSFVFLKKIKRERQVIYPNKKNKIKRKDSVPSAL